MRRRTGRGAAALPSRWWRPRKDAEKPAAAWAERVVADVAASAPQAMVKAGDGPVVPVTGAQIEIPVASTREALEAFGAAFGASALPLPEVRQADMPPRPPVCRSSVAPVEAEDVKDVVTTPVRPARPTSWRENPHPFTASRPGGCGACHLPATDIIHVPAEFAPWPALKAVTR